MNPIPPPDLLAFNGLDAASGEYLLPPMPVNRLAGIAQGQTFEEAELAELQQRSFDLTNPNAGVEADARELSETGWGVIFAQDADPALRDLLAPLLELRKSQAGDLYREFWGEDGYRPGETKDEYLARFGMGPGPANPEKVPYYLLIAAGPDQIPFRFQYQLDVQYAVGRVHFERPEEYAAYAESVVSVEKGTLVKPEACFFGVANPDDRATQMSSEYLVQPLLQKMNEALPKWQLAAQKNARRGQVQAFPDWSVEANLAGQATHQRLSDLLNGGKPPALFFSASHGIGFPNGHPAQLAQQGGLVCQDWPGPQLWRGALQEDFYFAGDHLSQDANLLGMMAFFFACYGAGTPEEDEFARQIWGNQPERKKIAPQNFIAELPKKMLGLSRGGALAVVGHIERAWGNSFYWGQAGPQLQVFSDCLERLIKGGYPIGYAMEVFNNRYAELSTDLSSELQEITAHGKKPNDLKLAGLWTAHNDARNYIILGDPAVRLRVAEDAPESRPVISIRPPLQSSPREVVLDPVRPAAQPASQAEIDYGLIDSLKEAQGNLSASLQQFASKLSVTLSRALDDITSLEVATYVSDEMSQVKYENGQFSGAKLRALARIKLDGDTLVCVPEEEGEINRELWDIHLDMVKQAQEARTELLKTAVTAAAGLVNILKPGG